MLSTYTNTTQTRRRESHPAQPHKHDPYVPVDRITIDYSLLLSFMLQQYDTSFSTYTILCTDKKEILPLLSDTLKTYTSTYSAHHESHSLSIARHSEVFQTQSRERDFKRPRGQTRIPLSPGSKMRTSGCVTGAFSTAL
jgi:hypothetical protein